METTWKHQVTTVFPLVFHMGNSKIPSGFPRKETPYAPVSGIPSHGNQGKTWATWKPGGNLGHMETRATLYGNPRFPKRNMSVTTRKLGFPTWKPGETTGKLQITKGKHEGNHMEISSFPKVNIKKTTWKPHYSQPFPWYRKLLRSGFQESLMWKPQGKFRFPTRKSVWNGMETSSFLYISP